jgi:hypothetical protein
MRVGSTGKALNAAYVVSLPTAGVAFDKILDNMGPFLKPREERARLIGSKGEDDEALSLLRTKELEVHGMGRLAKVGFTIIGDIEGDPARSGLLRRE